MRESIQIRQASATSTGAEKNGHSTSAISYHMNTLAKIGIIELASMQQVRGTWKRLYVFTAAVKPALPGGPS